MGMALRRLEIEESRDIARYGEQLKALGDEGSVAILEHVIQDERDHYRARFAHSRPYTPPAGAARIDAKAVLEEMLAKRNQGRKQPGAWNRRRHLRRQRRPRRHLRIVSGVSGATAGDPNMYFWPASPA